jgi:transposase
MKMSIGIDVAKRKIDVAFYDGESFKFSSFKNTRDGIEDFLKSIPSWPKDSILITMEATGSYYLLPAILLSEQGYAVSVVNPLIIKRYGQMKMNRIKTDKADAKLIADYGYHQKPYIFSQICIESHQIRQLLHAIDGLTTTITQCMHRIESLEGNPYASSVLVESLKRCIKLTRQEVKVLEKEMLIIIDNKYSTQYRQLNSIPGIGKRSAATIIAYFGSFEDFASAKKVASYLGITPMPKESGTSLKGIPSISKQGNPYIRKMLYMAALSASRFNRPCKNLYERLVEKGKPKKLALIAVENKLLRQVFAIVKHDRWYDDAYICSIKS